MSAKRPEACAPAAALAGAATSPGVGPGAERLTNVAELLSKMAALRPHAQAVVAPVGRTRSGRVRYAHLTFAQLERESGVLARGFQALGVGRGVRAALMVRPSLELFAIAFGLFRAGAVPVLVDPGLGRRSVGRALAEARPEAFVGVPLAHAARLVLGWGRESVRRCVTVGQRGPWGGVSLDEVARLGDAAGAAEGAATSPDDEAAILFTSGSTGPPKGARYTHRNFLAQVALIRRAYGIEPGEIDLPTFPLFALFDPALGTTAVLPDMDASRPASVRPERLVEAIFDFGISSLFGSPAVVDRLGRYGEARGLSLPTLRRVLSAGAPVPVATLARFTRLLAEGVEVFTPYGATESLPVASIGSGEILSETAALTRRGAGVCVGRPVEGVTVHVVEIADGAIPRWADARVLGPGAVGELVVESESTTRSYVARDDATSLAKILGAGERLGHRMGDVGYFDERGRLWYCGRKSQRVRTKAGPLFTDACESVFNVHPAVRRTALVGVPPAAGGVPPPAPQAPVLCVELDEGDGRGVDRRAVARELLALGAAVPATRAIQDVRFHPSFPVDVRHNAKIFRERLAEWAARGRPERAGGDVGGRGGGA